MADKPYDLQIHGGDAVTVTFTDGTTLAGDFLRWFPGAEGISCAITVPQAAVDLAAITSVYYIDTFRHVQKLTPNPP